MRNTATIQYNDLPDDLKAMTDAIFEIDLRPHVPENWILTGVEVQKEGSVIFVFDDGKEKK